MPENGNESTAAGGRREREREGRIQRRTDGPRRDEQASRTCSVRACVRARVRVRRRQFPGSGARRKEGRARERRKYHGLPLLSSLCVTSSRWPLGLPNAMMKGMRTHTAAEAEAGRTMPGGLALTQPSGPLTVAGGRGDASWAYGCVTAREVKRGDGERGSGAYDACTACPQCIAGTEAGEKGERTYDLWATPSGRRRPRGR